MASAATLTASIDPAQCDAPAHEAATALVTGANKGIGKEIARGLAKTGMYSKPGAAVAGFLVTL